MSSLSIYRNCKHLLRLSLKVQTATPLALLGLHLGPQWSLQANMLKGNINPSGSLRSRTPMRMAQRRIIKAELLIMSKQMRVSVLTSRYPSMKLLTAHHSAWSCPKLREAPKSSQARGIPSSWVNRKRESLCPQRLGQRKHRARNVLHSRLNLKTRKFLIISIIMKCYLNLVMKIWDRSPYKNKIL